jgi:tetratricopeptide (TPR) repeat protein
MQQAAGAIYSRTQPYRWAVYLASTGRQDEALADFQELARTGTPEDRAWAYMGRSQVLDRRLQFTEALAAARQALAIDPGLQPAWVSEGVALAALGRQEDALKVARRNIADLRAGRRKGFADLDVAEFARAFDGVEALFRADYQTAALRLNEERLPGEGAISNLRADRAQAFYLDHDAGGARRLASTERFGDERFPLLETEAHDDWRGAAAVADARRVEPGAPDPARIPGFAAELATPYARAGRLADAAALLSATPLDCYPCLIARGDVAALQHDWTAADRWYAEAARQGPSIPLAQTAWGQSLLDRGDVDGAIAKLEEAHRITPHFADPLELWGEALMRKGDHASAAAKFAEADKYAPRWGRNHMRWGEALMLSGRYAEARRQYETANGLDLSRPDRAALDVLLARTASGPLRG